MRLLLTEVFGADKCLMNYQGELYERKPTELEKVRLVAGHFGYGVHESFSRVPIYISVLRNPIDRYLSTYAEFLTNPRSKHHAVAQRYDANEFLQYALDSDVPSVWQQLHNLQCRLICGEPSYKKAREYIDTKYFLACPLPAVDSMTRMLSVYLGANDLVLPRVHETKQRMEPYKDMPPLSDASITLLINCEQEDALLYSYVQKAFSYVRETIEPKTIERAKTARSKLVGKIPPKELRFMGESDEVFIQHADYLSDCVMRCYGPDRHPGSILDIGCGYGRLAYGLRRSNFEGEYRGFDILGRHISWLNENFNSGQEQKRYQFLHADIYNQRYNPDGKSLDDLDLPYTIASFDCLASLSVFTHMYEEEVVKYIRYLKQFIKNGGSWVATFFALPYEFSLENQPVDAVYPLVQQVSENAFIHSAKEPLLVIAFKEQFLVNLFAREQLEVVDQRKGRWFSKDNSLELQDWFVLKNRVTSTLQARCLIVGAAKSGTTAVFYAVAKTLPNPILFFEEPLNSLGALPTVAVAKTVFLEHETEAVIREVGKAFDKRIAIIRDPRDNLVSRVLYEIADRPDLLRDDTVIGKLMASLERKQNSPRGVDLLYLIRLLCPDADAFIEEALSCSARMGRFIESNKADWFVLRYEDFVAGAVQELSAYVGSGVDHRITVDEQYQRVARTRSSGDWRNWFTETDIALLKSRIQPVMMQLGYGSDWALSDSPVIPPEHGAAYLKRLVDERRRQYQIFPYDLAEADVAAGTKRNTPSDACNICGGTQFAPGPVGRLADSGVMPCCRDCGSLERQRVVRSVFQALPIGFLDWRRVLQFSSDRGLNPSWFRKYEVSVYGGENSLDIQAIDRPDASYDLLTLNHVLEFVPDDLKGFSELVRILSPRGIMQVCFSAPSSRELSQDFSEPFGPHQAWHLYGKDLHTRFRCAANGLTVVELQEIDPCTGVREVVHLFFKDAAEARRVRSWLAAWSPTVCIA